MSMTSNSIRGTRVGSGPVGDVVRGEIAESQDVSFYCLNGHETIVPFATGEDVEIPETWTCRRCGFDAGQDADAPPPPPEVEVFKTHLDYVKERRDEDEGQQILSEALKSLRRNRGQ